MHVGNFITGSWERRAIRRVWAPGASAPCSHPGSTSTPALPLTLALTPVPIAVPTT